MDEDEASQGAEFKLYSLLRGCQFSVMNEVRRMQKQTLCIQKKGVLYPGHGANVVLMAVSDNDSLDLGPPAVQKASVWKDLLHSQVCEAAQAKNQAVMHHFLMDLKACRTIPVL